MSRRRAILNLKRNVLFSSAATRQIINGRGGIIKEKSISSKEINIASTSSFKYDSPDSGLKSTQQLDVDWSLFQNHTFFNSAEAKVNIAFEKIINSYPFDGSKRDVEEFGDSLTGFEKYVYDKFPKNKGYLYFQGTGTAGSFIQVNDYAGNQYPSFSKNVSGESILDPILKSFSIEMHLFVPTTTNDNQIVCQKISGSDQGITLAISQSSLTTSCELIFGIVSGTSHLTASTTITKGQFTHVCTSLNRKTSDHFLEIYKDSKLAASSSKSSMGQIGFRISPLLIGSGTIHNLTGSTGALRFVPQQRLSGAIDEFRIFHDIRLPDDQRKFARRNIFSSDELKLYFKFNEPTGSYTIDSTVLDSSGNSLHSSITNFTGSLRTTSSLSSPMTGEDLSVNPVLFPSFKKIVDFNIDLLTSASEYDFKNPNLITKLIPSHYFLEGQQFEGITDVSGTVGDVYGGKGIPGSGKMGSPQIIASLLYVWAKFFDELKMYIDHFSKLKVINYDSKESISDQFLLQFSRNEGFELPMMFNNSSVSQFVDGFDLRDDLGISSKPLQKIQNDIWRRILVNLRDISLSKGTLHSIKSFLRSVGINPDTSLRIREFGGKTRKSLSVLRQKKTEVSTLLDMSGTLSPAAAIFNASGVPTNKPFLMSSYLSGSRVEVGYPDISGSYVRKDKFSIHGISNATSDGLFTSGSWTFEGLYKFPILMTGSHPVTQSLVRLHVTGSQPPSSTQGMIANLLAISGTLTSSVKLVTQPSFSSNSPPMLEMFLTGVNVFDGSPWYVSFGRFRNDDPSLGSDKSETSSSYFLRCGRQNFGDLLEVHSTSSYFLEDSANNKGMISHQGLMSLYNVSGVFAVIGTQSIPSDPNRLLNARSLDNRWTDFTGKVGFLRFWSKGLIDSEWKEHVRNFKSSGVESPNKNFNFSTQLSGSFERLRFDATTDQPVTRSDSSGIIMLTDFTQNNLVISGTGFETNIQIIKPETFNYSYISSKFDEAATDNKVRIRGLKDFKNADLYDSEISPVYEILPNESPSDDARLSIDFSVIDALNEDITNIFSTLEFMDDAIGKPELMFSSEYPSLEEMRRIYFNRLVKKINLKSFFEFFKWFDSSMGMFIEQLIPRKVNYTGINYVIESHMLERPKYEYHFEEMYLGESNRHGLKGTILLRQIVGQLGKI